MKRFRDNGLIPRLPILLSCQALKWRYWDDLTALNSCKIPRKWECSPPHLPQAAWQHPTGRNENLLMANSEPEGLWCAAEPGALCWDHWVCKGSEVTHRKQLIQHGETHSTRTMSWEEHGPLLGRAAWPRAQGAGAAHEWSGFREAVVHLFQFAWEKMSVSAAPATETVLLFHKAVLELILLPLKQK